MKAVLVTFDFDPGANAYQAASCRMVADVSHLMVTRLDRLRDDGTSEVARRWTAARHAAGLAGRRAACWRG